MDAYVNKPYYTLDGEGSVIMADAQTTATAIPPCYGVIVQVEGSEDAHLGGEGSDNFAFISNGEIIATCIDGNSVLQVIDLTGRVVASYKGTNRIGTSGLVAGVYVLRIINGENVKTQKIVIS